MDVCESIGAGRSGGAGGRGVGGFFWGGALPFESCTQNLHLASPRGSGGRPPLGEPESEGANNKSRRNKFIILTEVPVKALKNDTAPTPPPTPPHQTLLHKRSRYYCGGGGE